MSLSKFENLFNYLMKITSNFPFGFSIKICIVPSIHMKDGNPVSLLISGPSPQSYGTPLGYKDNLQ